MTISSVGLNISGLTFGMTKREREARRIQAEANKHGGQNGKKVGIDKALQAAKTGGNFHSVINRKS